MAKAQQHITAAHRRRFASARCSFSWVVSLYCRVLPFVPLCSSVDAWDAMHESHPQAVSLCCRRFLLLLRAQSPDSPCLPWCTGCAPDVAAVAPVLPPDSMLLVCRLHGQLSALLRSTGAFRALAREGLVHLLFERVSARLQQEDGRWALAFELDDENSQPQESVATGSADKLGQDADAHGGARSFCARVATPRGLNRLLANCCAWIVFCCCFVHFFLSLLCQFSVATPHAHHGAGKRRMRPLVGGSAPPTPPPPPAARNKAAGSLSV